MTVTVNGIDLHYEIEGKGEPLLWLHGFFGVGADWKYIFDGPPAGFRIIAPDLRGHGASTNPSDVFSFRQAAADVIALLDHLAIDRVRAIGVSGGGLVLLHLATSVPARIASMLLVSAPPYFPAQARAIQRQSSLAMFSEPERELMRRQHARDDQQLERLLAHCRALADSYDDVNFTPPYLATITADTLIVFGDRDPLYPVSLAFEMFAAIPRCSLWVVPNGGHAPIFGAAAATFGGTAIAFLEGRSTMVE